MEMDPQTLGAAAIGMLALLWLVNTAMLGVLAHRLHRERESRAEMFEALSRELGTLTPAKAAVAALLVSAGERRATMQEVERELRELMDQWAEVERLAERVAARMSEVGTDAAAGQD